MSQTLGVSGQVQKALAHLNALLKQKRDLGFNEDVRKLNIIKELLDE